MLDIENQGTLVAEVRSAMYEVGVSARYHRAPSVLYRPGLSIDGNQWCALYGENLQAGVAGFGDSPEEAMADFDRAFAKKLSA